MLIQSKHDGYVQGIRLVFVDCGGDAPDNSGVNAAAVANAALSKESLDWYKQIYAESAPDRAKAAATNERVSNAQLAALDSNTALSNDYANYAKTTFRPMEQAIVADAQNYDSIGKTNEAVGKAQADVNAGFSNAQGQQQRAMSRMGVNPSSGRSMAMQNQNSISQAAALAGASSQARDKIEVQGYARKMDAANLGRGLASNQATSAGVALNAGNSAVSNAGQTMAQSSAAAAQMGQGFSTAGNLNQSAGNLYASAANITQQANNSQMEMVGTLAGAGITKWSDKNKKKNIKPVTDEQALKSIEKTPVSTWDYKDGEGDGGHHTGPMAQEVQRNIGDKAGPNGKMIDLITLNGNNMAAIAALSRKVDKLAKATKGA
jgi:hypothetical protein